MAMSLNDETKIREEMVLALGSVKESGESAFYIDVAVSTCERLVAEAVAAEREEWRVTYERAILRAEAAEAELSHVDAVLTRRPALDDLPNRTSKIEKAINAAKRTDALDEALGLLGFYLPVKP
jgi:hypothetical protein